MLIIDQFKKLNHKIIIVKNIIYTLCSLSILFYYPKFNDVINNCLFLLFGSICFEFLYNYITNTYTNLHKSYIGIFIEYVLLCSNFGINYLLGTYYNTILENLEYFDNISNSLMYFSLTFYRIAYYRSLVYVYTTSIIMVLFLLIYPFIKKYIHEISNFINDISRIPRENIMGTLESIRNGQSIELSFGSIKLISIPPKNLSINEEELERIAPKIASSTINELCCICLDNQSDDKQLIRKLSCGHTFHCNCVDQWFIIGHKLCPICRSIIIK